MFILDPTLEEGIDEVKQKIEGIVTGREGTVITFEKIGRKRLAYPIAKHQYGIYYLVNLQGDGKIVQALDYFLRLSPVVLRHIILAFTPKDLRLRKLTRQIQQEEAERMRMGGKPLAVHNTEEGAHTEETALAVEIPPKESVRPSEPDSGAVPSESEEPSPAPPDTVEKAVDEDTAVKPDDDEQSNETEVE